LAQGLAATRSKAQQLIREGLVRINGEPCKKSGTAVEPDIDIEVAPNPYRFVGRGGIKLNQALETFRIQINGKNCMDIGASTGGFTDCLLQRDAQRVYAVDVGHDQLVPALREDSRVVSLEGCDIRHLQLDREGRMDFIGVDVSFISLMLVLPHVKRFLHPQGEAVILIKPQFEVGPGVVDKKGIVKDIKILASILVQILEFAQIQGFSVLGLIQSPIKGKEGNREYLAHLKMDSRTQKTPIQEMVGQLFPA